jgi:hypothetical protein
MGEMKLYASSLKKICKLTLLVCPVFVFLALGAKAQERKKVRQVKGEWILSNDITPTQARENAINQAKLESMHQAGVPESVFESNLLYQTDDPKHIKDLFESLTNVTISGEVSEYKIVKEDKRINEFSAIVYEVWIDATVLIHKTARDQGFNFDVAGLHDTYTSPDKLSFTVKPWKDGFLTIFIVTEKESSQLFPNSAERQTKLTGQTSYDFPRSPSLDYEISTSGNLEVNSLVLLLTRDEIPFTKDPTAPNILKFIAGIDPAGKCLKTYSLLIKK